VGRGGAPRSAAFPGATVAKVPPEAVQALRAEWRRRRTLNASLTWLASFELTHHQMTALIEKFGNAVVTVLKTDPYLLVREVPGFGFKRVDVVARKMGAAKEDPSRVRAGVVHCVSERLDQGDCWVDYEELIELANALLVMDVADSRERIERELDGLIDDGTLACVSLGGWFLVAHPQMYEMERELAAVFTERLPNSHSARADAVAAAADKLNAPQRRALEASARHNLVLVSGGAGSGILEHEGVPAFLHDTEELYEAADAEGQEWRDLVHAWWDLVGQVRPALGQRRRAARARARSCACERRPTCPASRRPCSPASTRGPCDAATEA
jgi:hypothetical protein